MYTVSGLENREYGRRDPKRCLRGTLNPQNSAQASPTSGGRSVGTVRSRTQAMEFVLCTPYTRMFQIKVIDLNDI
jgi:hypothetical protein